MIETQESPKHLRLHRISTLQNDWANMSKVTNDTPGLLQVLCAEANADLGDSVSADFALHLLPVTHLLSEERTLMIATAATDLRISRLAAAEYDGMTPTTEYFRSGETTEPFRSTYIKFLDRILRKPPNELVTLKPIKDEVCLGCVLQQEGGGAPHCNSNAVRGFDVDHFVGAQFMRNGMYPEMVLSSSDYSIQVPAKYIRNPLFLKGITDTVAILD